MGGGGENCGFADRIDDRLCRLERIVIGDADCETGPFSWRRGESDGASEARRAFFETDQSPMALRGKVARGLSVGYTLAIVLDGDEQRFRLELEPDGSIRGRGMAADVREAFLNHAQHGQL